MLPRHPAREDGPAAPGDTQHGRSPARGRPHRHSPPANRLRPGPRSPPNGSCSFPPCTARRNRKAAAGRPLPAPPPPERPGTPGLGTTVPPQSCPAGRGQPRPAGGAPSPGQGWLPPRATRPRPPQVAPRPSVPCPPPAVSCPCPPPLLTAAAHAAATARGRRLGARPPAAPASAPAPGAGRSQRRAEACRAPGPRRRPGRLGGAGSERAAGPAAAMKSPREAGEPPPGQCGPPRQRGRPRPPPSYCGRPAGSAGRPGAGGSLRGAAAAGRGWAAGSPRRGRPWRNGLGAGSGRGREPWVRPCPRRGAGGSCPLRRPQRPPPLSPRREAAGSAGSSDVELLAPSAPLLRRGASDPERCFRVRATADTGLCLTSGQLTAIAEAWVCWETG